MAIKSRLTDGYIAPGNIKSNEKCSLPPLGNDGMSFVENNGNKGADEVQYHADL